MINTTDMLQLVWPLSFVLCFLFFLRKVGDDLRPVVNSVVTGLSGDANRNAKSYAFGAILALAASLQELSSVATDLGWAYVAAAAKILQPGLVAIIAYVRPAPSPQPVKTNGVTASPFPTSTQTPPVA